MSTPRRIYGLNSDGSVRPDMDISGTTVFVPAMTKLVLQGSMGETNGREDELMVFTFQRKWKCRRDFFLKYRPRKGDLDFQHQRCQISDWTYFDEADITTFVVNYNGFIEKPGAPAVQESGPVYEIRSVPLQPVFRVPGDRELFTDVTGGGQITMEYVAPTVVREWAAEERPTWEKKFLSPHKLFGNEGIQRLGYRIGGSAILATGSNSLIEYLYPFELKAIRTSLDPRPEGAIYRIKEVIELRPVQEIWIGKVR